MTNYSKHKDRSPQDTVFEIQRILNEAGLFTNVQWFESSYNGVSSNRVTLYPTDLGSNGKGTDPLYASASGYAELMERIQNNILAFRHMRPGNADGEEFIIQPDERIIPFDELVDQDDPFLAFVADGLSLTDPLAKKLYLKNIAETCENRTDGTILALPYADLSAERIVWLPYYIQLAQYGSNGMAAGNTMEEAMVQGISEIFERYVNGRLVRGECVPPEIPDEALKPFSVWKLIEQIRAEGKYSVTVLDCSLGKGFPVAGLVITDLDRGTFCLKLGSHPSFAVSVERTLTEIFQGIEDLDNATGFCAVSSEKDCRGYNNGPNVGKIGMGFYPAKLFTAEPDWEYVPWTQWEGLDNRGFLKKMLELIRSEGWTALVRDVSHLGFPACHVIIPGVSELCPANLTMSRSTNSRYRNVESLSHFPDLTPEEEERLLRLIQFKENSVLENTIGIMSMRPLCGDRMLPDRIAAFLAFKRGDYKEAQRFFRKTDKLVSDPNEKQYLHCLAELSRYRDFGMNPADSYKLLHKLFRQDIASRAEEETADPAAMMRKAFPKMNCYDCEHCELAGKECMMPDEKEIWRKIKTAMSHSSVSQTELLEKLGSLISE